MFFRHYFRPNYNTCLALIPKLLSTKENNPFLYSFSQTPEELEDVSDLEEDHDACSRTSIQTEGKTDRVCIIPVDLKNNLMTGKMLIVILLLQSHLKACSKSLKSFSTLNRFVKMW